MSQQGSLATTAVVAGNTAGNIVQLVQSSTGAQISITTTIPQDGTIPQQTEGTEFLTLTITPSKVTNRLVLMCPINAEATPSSEKSSAAALFQDATANALTTILMDYAPTDLAGGGTFDLLYTMVAGTILPTTFKLRAGLATAGGSLVINRNNTYGGFVTTFTIMEIEV